MSKKLEKAVITPKGIRIGELLIPGKILAPEIEGQLMSKDFAKLQVTLLCSGIDYEVPLPPHAEVTIKRRIGND